MGEGERKGDVWSALLGVLPKIRTPLQLVGLAIVVLGFLTSKFLGADLRSTIAAASVGTPFLILAQCFVFLPQIPPKSRVLFLITTFCICSVLVVFLVVITSLWLSSALEDKTGTRKYPPAEQRLIGITNELDLLKGSYETMLDPKARAPQVNTDARKLAQKMQSISDSELGLGMQIFKYQSIAYTWAIVAGSDSDQKIRLSSAEEVLNACTEATSLVIEANRQGPYDQKKQDIRDWIIKDDAESRINRLTAVARCIQWQINGDRQDLVEVQRLIQGLPQSYVEIEHPERSQELQPCLKREGERPR